MVKEYEDIIARAKYLHLNTKFPIRDCVRQAIIDLQDPLDMNDMYCMFGISIEDYIDSIVAEMGKEEK